MMDLQLDSKDTWAIKDRATQEAALGAHALGIGDTLSASRHYSEAGRILESESSAALAAPERELHRFLAASQYFHGGDYTHAQKLVRRVEERFLPEKYKQLLRSFLRDVDLRASRTYVPTIRQRFHELSVIGNFSECLELLKNHPFVLERSELSYARATICEELRRYHAAAIHHARTMKFDPENPKWPYVAMALVIGLPAVGRGEEAFEYLQFLLKEVEHPVAKIAASVLYYRRASKSEGDDRQTYLKKQIAYYHEAWDGFRQLPESHQKDANLRDMMSFCLELAAFAYWKLDDNERALQISNEGIDFNHKFAGFWLVRGMIQEGNRKRLEDFREAIRLGEQSYIPHYHLAQDDLEMGHFDQALRHVEDALARNPSLQIQGVLYGWKAICLSHTDNDATVEDVFNLFERAIALAPDIPEVRENYEAFQEYTDKALWRMELAKRPWRPSKITDPGWLDTGPKISRPRELDAA